MGAEQKESLLAKYIAIFFVVCGYWIVSIFTVFVNKALLSGINLDAPLFIAFYQTLITSLICLGKKVLSRRWPNKFSFPDTNIWDIYNIKTFLPLAIMFTSMIATNNLCLKYVSLAFYYVGRSLTTIFNVILSYVILRQKTSKGCLACCLLIIYGFYLGVDQEELAGSLSVLGTFFGVMASLSLSLFSILTKKVLANVKEDIWALSYYNNVYSTLIFIPLMIFNGELPAIMNYKDLWATKFLCIMTVGGICGFSVGFLTSLQIKYTSALTHNISGTAKACAQTVLATYWYQEVKSLLWWASNLIILIASAGYARMKQVDMETKYTALPVHQTSQKTIV